MNLVNQCVDSFTSSQITQIDINITAEDKLIWKFTSHGGFTPQSFQKMIHAHQGETSNLSENMFPWKKFWAVQRVAPKIKLFIRRAIHNGLAVSKRIGRFVEGATTNCHFCHNEDETVDHLLIHCTFAQAVWFDSPLGFRLQENQYLSLETLTGMWFILNDNDSTLALGIAICWAI